MHNVLTICRRELGAYFNSPVAYIVVTVFLLASGYLFFSQVFLVGEATLRDFFGISPLIFIFFAPAVTMRLIAEEKRSGTMELLITLPVKDWEVVVGKFLASLGLLGTAILLTLTYPLSLSTMGKLDWGAVTGGYLGLLLLGSTYLAIGLMASSWTRNQVVAFIISFAITFALYLSGKLLPLMPPSLAPIIEYVSLDSHFNNIARGVIDTRDLVYYLSLVGACLFVATQSLESRRWR
ncbi:MAG: ABC transporter permease subunit [Deltaproteobacteria bacterium]|nr:ABC transporter permease subunit [Deltaproteobacteria bacterium]